MNYLFWPIQNQRQTSPSDRKKVSPKPRPCAQLFIAAALAGEVTAVSKPATAGVVVKLDRGRIAGAALAHAHGNAARAQDADVFARAECSATSRLFIDIPPMKFQGQPGLSTSPS